MPCFCGTDRHLLTNTLPFEGAWVQCDGCERWCHGECAGLSLEEAEEVEAYTCPLCVDARANARLAASAAAGAAAALAVAGGGDAAAAGGGPAAGDGSAEAAEWAAAEAAAEAMEEEEEDCLLYTSPSPRDGLLSRMPSSA